MNLAEDREEPFDELIFQELKSASMLKWKSTEQLSLLYTPSFAVDRITNE
jgi:hypothetical protein